MAMNLINQHNDLITVILLTMRYAPLLVEERQIAQPIIMDSVFYSCCFGHKIPSASGPVRFVHLPATFRRRLGGPW